MEYKLENFGLNKQSLKRKIKSITVDSTKIVKLFNKKGTKYKLSDIKYIVETLYGSSIINIDEPLSIYYAKHNKKKFKDLMDMIEIKEKNNIEEKISDDVQMLHDECYEDGVYTDREVFENGVIDISKKYSLLPEYVEKLFNGIEEEWLEKIED